MIVLVTDTKRNVAHFGCFEKQNKTRKYTEVVFDGNIL